MRAQKSLPLFALLSLLLLPAVNGYGQNTPALGGTSIHGVVRDAVSHKALQYVIVIAEEQDSGYAGQSETDGLGRFDFEGLQPYVYIVKVHHPGYDDASQRIDLSITGNNYLDFQLKPIPQNGSSSVSPEGSEATLSVSGEAAPEAARKEFEAARELLQSGKSKDVDKAIDHLRKAVKTYPNFADAYFLLGTAYMQQAKAPEAQSALEKAAQIEPKMGSVYITLGMVENYEKNYPEAEKNLSRGIELSPNSSQAEYELGKSYWAMGRWQDAEPHALRAISLQPNLPPAHILLGNIYLRKQDPQGALKEFQEYLRLDPKGPMAQAAQGVVDKLQASVKTAQ
jgi:tetratricopeptide (TPR) repeat protein